MTAGHDPGQDPELAEGVVGRALHALEPDEEDRVAEHLRECAACRALLAETHETMAALAHAVPVVEPSISLRERILAAAAAEPDPPRPAPERSRPTNTRELPAVPAPAVDDEPPAGPTTGPLPLPLPRRRVAAILALAAVVAAIVVFAARGAGPDPADPRAVVAQRAQQVVANAEARDPAVRSASMIERDTGTIAAVVLDDGSVPHVVPLDMPAIGSGRMFVLWRVAGITATPVGTVDPTGSLTPTPAGPPAAGNPPVVQRAYALSAEPVGTAPSKPSVIVASGPLV